MRIITVEDPIEFALTHPHVVQLEVSHANLAGQGAITARSLVHVCMRLRPTYLVVGEARDEAAWDMVTAMRVGPAGSLTTTHADSPRGALKRLEHLCLWATDGPPLVAVRSTLAETIHLIVIVRRQTDPASGGVRRVVTAVAEVRGLEGEVYQVEDLLEWRDGALCPTGYGPSERLLSRAESHGVAIPDLGGRGAFKGGRAGGGERTPW